jgi:hypothetical protein
LNYSLDEIKEKPKVEPHFMNVSGYVNFVHFSSGEYAHGSQDMSKLDKLVQVVSIVSPNTSPPPSNPGGRDRATFAAERTIFAITNELKPPSKKTCETTHPSATTSPLAAIQAIFVATIPIQIVPSRRGFMNLQLFTVPTPNVTPSIIGQNIPLRLNCQKPANFL